jgi:hypothetical protein
MAREKGIPEWQLEMFLAEPSGFMRDVVADNRGSRERSSVIPKKEEGVRETGAVRGWRQSPPLTPPDGIRYVDALCDAADAEERRRR